jgi:hypothetical protein
MGQPQKINLCGFYTIFVFSSKNKMLKFCFIVFIRYTYANLLLTNIHSDTVSLTNIHSDTVSW